MPLKTVCFTEDFLQMRTQGHLNGYMIQNGYQYKFLYIGLFQTGGKYIYFCVWSYLSCL